LGGGLQSSALDLRVFRRAVKPSTVATVAATLLLGYRNRDIATTLGSAATTVKKRLTHVFDKVGVDTRSQLIARMA
jgi:DNA-binding NarL/FixJ family response regulator